MTTDDLIARMAAKAADARDLPIMETFNELLDLIEEFLAQRERDLEQRTTCDRCGSREHYLEDCPEPDMPRLRRTLATRPPWDEREHTATSRHLLDVTVTVPGDNAIDKNYLVDVLMWGLEQHNHKVMEFTPNPKRDFASLDDHVIEPVAMSITPDIGLDGENATCQHDYDLDHLTDGQREAVIRQCAVGMIHTDDNDNPEGAEMTNAWENDELQFSRLLAEIVATQDDLDFDALAEAMDLDVANVDELFDRAQQAWQEHKSASLDEQERRWIVTERTAIDAVNAEQAIERVVEGLRSADPEVVEQSAELDTTNEQLAAQRAKHTEVTPREWPVHIVVLQFARDPDTDDPINWDWTTLLDFATNVDFVAGGVVGSVEVDE